MVQPFVVHTELTGEDALKFFNYDRNPFDYETPESMKYAKAARIIANKIAEEENRSNARTS